jgi:hypothetical protein
MGESIDFWRLGSTRKLVDVHDFPADAVGKSIRYGVYGLASNDGFVSVGVDHDTPVFASPTSSTAIGTTSSDRDHRPT